MTEQKATNIHWHDGEVTREKRATLLGHRGATLWFTGLSGSGKSTVAVALEGVLHDMGLLCYRLDGDNVRFGINKNLGFSEEDRAENIRRVGEISKLFVDSGVLVLSSFISPYLRDRELVRQIHEEAGMAFIEVFVDCSLEAAESRDLKAFTKKHERVKSKTLRALMTLMRRQQLRKFTCGPISRPLSKKLRKLSSSFERGLIAK